MHRLFCKKIGRPGETAELEKREEEHVFRVFRAVPGEEIELIDGRGVRARAVIRPGRKAEITEVFREEPEKPLLHLCCALPRRQKLDVLLKQAAELGAATIRPLRCSRSVADGDPSERWELLLQEACKQSGNPFLPEILPPASVSDALKALKRENVTVFYGSVERVPLPEDSGAERAWFVGPEGGFTPEEETLLRENGAKALNLGPHVLRLETAAVCGLAVLRLLLVPLCLCLLLCSCRDRDLSRHPLMLKGKRYQNEGNGELARKFFNRLAARFPDAPEVQLALGSVSDELLDDPAAALYHYREFLRLAPESAQKETVQRYLEVQRTKLRKLYLDEKERQLLEENQAMRQQLTQLKKYIYWQQKRISELQKRAEGGQKR